MLRLSKKIEYGILAMQYIAINSSRKMTAKEIAEQLNISFEFLSKVLQSLMKRGIVISQQGVKGGYNLSRSADEITIGEIIESLEGKTAIVECFESGTDTCGRAEECNLRKPLGRIQNKINKLFHTTTLAELAEFGSIQE